jgi:LacI family transcriptional regulator
MTTSTPTLKELARRLELSVGTVSMALRGDGRIRAATRERVRAAALAAGYLPNRAAAELASKKKQPHFYRIAYLTRTWDWSNGPAIRRQVTVARERAGEIGMEFLHTELGAAETWGQVSRRLYRQGVDGILIGRYKPEETGAIRDGIDWDTFTSVTLGTEGMQLPLHRVRGGIAHAVATLGNIAREKGYCRIGFAPGRHADPIPDDRLRLGQALAFQNDHAGEEGTIPPYVGGMHDAEQFIAWVRAHQPDCVLGFHTGMYNFLKSAFGADKPAFAAMVLTEDAALDGAIAGMLLPIEEISRLAVDLLYRELQFHRQGLPEKPYEIVTPFAFREGRSLS